MPCSRQIHRRTSGLSQARHPCCTWLHACVRTSHGPRDLRGAELSEQEHLCEALKLLRTWLSGCSSSSLQFLIGLERKASHRAFAQSLPGWPSRHRCPDGKKLAKLGAGQACMHNVRKCAQQEHCAKCLSRQPPMCITVACAGSRRLARPAPSGHEEHGALNCSLRMHGFLFPHLVRPALVKSAGPFSAQNASLQVTARRIGTCQISWQQKIFGIIYRVVNVPSPGRVHVHLFDLRLCRRRGSCANMCTHALKLTHKAA